MKIIPAILIGLLIGGCTRYQYKLVEPAGLATTIGTKSDVRIPIDPLEYVFRTVEGRLVVRIFNPTGGTIQLTDESGVVDPEGQSHPLPMLTILPKSHGKLILPPLRPRFRDTRPNIGFGVGVGQYYRPRSSPRHHFHHHGPYHYPYHHHYYDPFMYDPWVYEPYYLDIFSASDPIYWDWKGEGTVRLMLVYQRGEERFRHDFVFQRMKM